MTQQDPFAGLDDGRPPWDALGAFVPAPQPHIPGAETGPLVGLRFASKDIFDVEGFVTGCGNPDWARSHAPAVSHAPTVRALLDAGATLAGKTITDEMAFSLNGQNFHYGMPTNVNAPGRITGGSSCGSASAVAGGLVDTALGSDTGGSVRIPASYCGLFGLRPSHGRITLEGVNPLAPSFDTVGWFARDAELFRRVGKVLLEDGEGEAGRWQRLLLAEDALALATPAVQAALAPHIERLEQRIGPATRVQAATAGLSLEDWMWHFRHLQAREIVIALGDWVAEAQPRFGPEIQERFDWVHSITDEQVAEAKPLRETFVQHMATLLGEDALMVLPTAPGIAPRSDEDAEALRAHRSAVLSLTSISGLSRLPEITLPLATVDGCPVGLSLMAPFGSDADLLMFAEEFCRVPEERGDL